MYALTNYHPFVLFFYFVTAVCLTMFFMHPVLLLLSLFCSFALFTAIKGLHKTGYSLLFFLLIALTNPVFSHNGMTPLLFINGNPITLEAIVYGVFMGVMLLSTFYWLKVFRLVMTTDKLMALFAGALPKLSLLLSMVLHFVPGLAQKGKSIYAAQKALGVYQTAKLPGKIKLSLCVLSALITQALEGAADTADSMHARGYATGKRTAAHVYKFRKKDAGFLFLLFILTGIFLYYALSGGADFYFYPQLAQVRLSFSTVCMYTAYGSLMCMPLFIFAKGELQWKYLQLKM